MDRIAASEARRHLPRLLDRVACGESLTITGYGRPVARLVPVTDCAKLKLEAPYEATVTADYLSGKPLMHMAPVRSTCCR